MGCGFAGERRAFAMILLATNIDRTALLSSKSLAMTNLSSAAVEETLAVLKKASSIAYRSPGE
jgi:hypothetical protein